ncbi:MAG TPA: hypothetical protein H9895_04290 [Candidatus Pseudogracilibacillus intestinigallinarum]|uniref:Uncharacterized protein n=2 Tax=Pseudogracilibacillus TaxID=1494958 RepID=A0A9D1PKQ1_9BACI|nr:hypothetical protein [Candidatus Pseudogracilibacillus intestinigallinarum]
MVKQSPFQHDLFDFTYIEEQVKNLKKSLPEKEMEDLEEQTLKKLVEEQTFILRDIDERLHNIEKKQQKRKWF